MKADIDKEACTGCELCVDTCPEVFEMTDDGVARAKVDEVPAGAAQRCQQAADECPADAIKLSD